MEAKELKLYNYVTIDNDKHWSLLKDIPQKVTSITILKESISIGLNYGEYHQKDEFIKPILLTREWFLKFGEEKTKRISCFELYGDDSRGYHYASNEASDWIFMKYVHQLQNLYFALTNEELCLKS